MTQVNIPTAAAPVRLTALLAPAIAQALIALDFAIIYVALPELAASLRLTLSEMQWVVSLYGLTFAGLLLLGGSLCDRIGARRIFSAGMTIFLLASLLGGLAPDGLWLLIARGGQGMAAALLQPAVLALMAQRFHGETHRRALAIWSAIGALGLVAGVMAGGILTALSWRILFFINIPPGLLALWLVVRDFPLPPLSGEIQRAGAGALVGCAAAGSLVWALMRYAETGQPDFFANRLAAVLALLFILHERFAPLPLLSRTLRDIPALFYGWLSSACYMASVGSQFYAMTLMWQQTLQHDPLTTGLMFTPLAIFIVMGNILCPRLMRRYSAAQVLSVGFACAAGGLWLLSSTLSGSLSAGFIAGIVLSGIGHGLIYPAMFTTGLTSVPVKLQGRASAIIITSQYISGAVMLALISILLGVEPVLADWPPVFHLLSAAACVGMLVSLCIPTPGREGR